MNKEVFSFYFQMNKSQNTIFYFNSLLQKILYNVQIVCTPAEPQQFLEYTFPRINSFIEYILFSSENGLYVVSHLTAPNSSQINVE